MPSARSASSAHPAAPSGHQERIASRSRRPKPPCSGIGFVTLWDEQGSDRARVDVDQEPCGPDRDRDPYRGEAVAADALGHQVDADDQAGNRQQDGADVREHDPPLLDRALGCGLRRLWGLDAEGGGAIGVVELQVIPERALGPEDPPAFGAAQRGQEGSAAAGSASASAVSSAPSPSAAATAEPAMISETRVRFSSTRTPGPMVGVSVIERM